MQVVFYARFCINLNIYVKCNDMNHHVSALLPDSLAAYFGVLKVMVCVPYVF